MVLVSASILIPSQWCICQQKSFHILQSHFCKCSIFLLSGPKKISSKSPYIYQTQSLQFLAKRGQHSWGYLLVVLTKLQIHFDPCKSHNDWCAAPGPLRLSQSHLVCPVWSLNSVTCQQHEIVGNLDHCHTSQHLLYTVSLVLLFIFHLMPQRLRDFFDEFSCKLNQMTMTIPHYAFLENRFWK